MIGFIENKQQRLCALRDFLMFRRSHDNSDEFIGVCRDDQSTGTAVSEKAIDACMPIIPATQGEYAVLVWLEKDGSLCLEHHAVIGYRQPWSQWRDVHPVIFPTRFPSEDIGSDANAARWGVVYPKAAMVVDIFAGLGLPRMTEQDWIDKAVNELRQAAAAS